MKFADSIPGPRPRAFVITVPHDYQGDLEELRRGVQEAAEARGERFTYTVERAPPPPGPHEHRVTVTSKRR